MQWEAKNNHVVSGYYLSIAIGVQQNDIVGEFSRE